MNPVNGVTFGFTVQVGDSIYDSTQAAGNSEAQNTQDSNSFLSILNLLDTNADGKIDTEELKFGAGFMINSMIQSRDQNSDGTLTAEELGVSPAVTAQLDTDSDGTVSAKELITQADKVIDGLVSALDTNGDGALSQEELAIVELLFAGKSSLGAGQQSVNSYQSTTSGTEATQQNNQTLSLTA